MANSITLAKEYQAALDRAYAKGALTAVLNANPDSVRPTGRAGSFEIAKMALVGAGDYSRATGFAAGDVTLTWEEKSYTQDRGRSFTIDAMDDLETAGVAFGNLAGEFLRTKVIPEVDAFRFAKIASTSGIQTTTAANLTTSAGTLAALDVAIAAVGDKEADMENLHLFLSWAQYTLLKNSAAATRFVSPNQDPSREFMTFDNIPVTVVPSSRFYTGVTMDAGATSSAGGYAKTSGAKDINFLLLDKASVFADMKHAVPRIFTPAENQSADAYKFDYRYYHDAWVLDNKVNGIYLHKAA